MLTRIINHLILKYYFMPNIGLMHGKMGGVLFLYEYAKYTGKSYLNNYAGELLESIYDDFTSDLPIDFENGLSGIGWGVEYLVKNGFVEGNTDELLEDIDSKIMELSPLRIKDMSLYTGLGGIIFYMISRMRSYKRANTGFPFSKGFIEEIHLAVNNPDFLMTTNKNIQLLELVKDFNLCYSNHIDHSCKLIIPEDLIGVLPHDMSDMDKIPLGLYQGLTGIALKTLGL